MITRFYARGANQNASIKSHEIVFNSNMLMELPEMGNTIPADSTTHASCLVEFKFASHDQITLEKD